MGIEARITSKGQATIPIEVRESLDLKPGDRIAFIKLDQGFLIIPRNRPVESLFGSLAEYAVNGNSFANDDDAIGEAVSDHVEGRRT